MARRAVGAVVRMVMGLWLCTLMVWLPIVLPNHQWKYSFQAKYINHDYDNIHNQQTSGDDSLLESAWFGNNNLRQNSLRPDAFNNHINMFNNNNNNDIDQKHSKSHSKTARPKLYIHVGPPKTATTTLQTQLTLIMEELSMDNYEYIGRWYHPVMADDNGTATTTTTNTNTTTTITVRNRRMDSTAVWMFRYVLDDRKPEVTMEALRDELQKEYGTTGVNLVVSEETLGANYRKKEHYKQLAETVGQDWDIVIVGTYRRLIEWIPSSKFQQERMQHLWPGQGGRDLGPLFPEVLEMKKFYRNYKYLDTIMDLVDDTFPFRILNLHDEEQDLLTQFTCTILVNATHSCQKAQQKHAAAALATATMLNARTDDTSGNILYYDAIGIEAVMNRQWIQNATHARRDKVYRKIQGYQEQFKKKTAADMAQICPTEKQLYTLFNRSLQLEESIFATGQVANVDATTEHADDKKQRAQQHEKVFQDMIRKKTFCWIDLEKELMDPEWKRFFQIHEQDFFSSKSRSSDNNDDDNDDDNENALDES